jgi:hypothetical protein
MKNSIFNSFITVAAFSLAFGLSSHATAEQNPEQVAADGVAKFCSEQASFGTIPSLDASKMEGVIVTGLMGAIEKQDLELNTEAQNRAESQYQRYSASNSSITLPPGHAYQSVAIAF